MFIRAFYTWLDLTKSKDPRPGGLSATDWEQLWPSWRSQGLACPRGEIYRMELVLPVWKEILWDCKKYPNKQKQKKHYSSILFFNRHFNRTFLSLDWYVFLWDMEEELQLTTTPSNQLLEHCVQKHDGCAKLVSEQFTSLKASLNSPPGAIPSCSVMWAETLSRRICIRPDMSPFWQTGQKKRKEKITPIFTYILQNKNWQLN